MLETRKTKSAIQANSSVLVSLSLSFSFSFSLSLSLVFISTVYASSSEPKEDFLLVPGVRLGVAKIGMTKSEILKDAGKHDRAYTLPTGENVEYSEWKDPDKTTTIRMFYDRQDKLTQVATNGLRVATADGISIKSRLEELNDKYKNLKVTKYTAKDAHIDYYDDVKLGICFEFTRPGSADSADDKAERKHMYAIIVHSPGKAVLPDVDERPTSKD